MIERVSRRSTRGPASPSRAPTPLLNGHEAVLPDGKILAVLFRWYAPHPLLRGFVHDFWLYDGYAAPHLRERILPAGTFELVVNLREDELRIYDPDRPDRCRRFSGALVSGAYGRGVLTDAREETSIMGVHFEPGGAFPFLGLPARELADTHVDLQDRSPRWNTRSDGRRTTPRRPEQTSTTILQEEA
jgi:hypothetical protein